MKKIFTLLVLLCAVWANAEIRVVNLDADSNIEEILGESFESIDSLKVTGYLSHDNLKPIANKTSKQILYLDLGECEVENNEIPACGINPIPHSIISLNPFIYNNVLCGIVLPKNLEIIGEYALATTRIEKINLPKTLKYIGEGAFDCCHYISGTVVVPEEVDTLFYRTFYYNDKITKMVLPSNLKFLEESSLAGMLNLKEINFPEGLEEIGYEACAAWYHFEQEQITLPSTLKELGRKAFRLSCIKEVIFNTECPLPDIKELTFYGNNIIQRVVLPKYLMQIGEKAFAHCEELKQVYVAAIEPPVIDTSTFEKRWMKTLYVPVGAKEAYAAAEYWKDFGEIVEVEEFPTAGREAVIAGHGDSTARTFGASGAAIIEGEGTRYAIYTTDGREVAAGIASGRTEVTLPQGIYIVSCGTATRSIAVR